MKNIRFTILEMLSMIVMLAGLSAVNLTAGVSFEVEGKITAKTGSAITVDNKQFLVNLLTRIYNNSGLLIDFDNLSTGQDVKIVGEVVALINLSQKINVLDNVTEDSFEVIVKGE